jgi:hypothetical protein
LVILRGQVLDLLPPMPWNASLDWAEEVFALWIVLPPVIIAVALLWYFAPRIGNKRQ